MNWKSLLLAAILLAGASIVATALAQVPPHQPGTVCYTPEFWCWLYPPQPPGSTCFCASPYGSVSGVAG
jgi:hypothetical protein